MQSNTPNPNVPTERYGAHDVLTMPNKDFDPDSIYQFVEDDNFNNGDKRFIALMENMGGKQNRLHGHAA